MSDEFQMPPEGAQGKSAACAGACPLALIQAKSLERLFREPFRKRHPIIFWGFFCALLCLAAYGLWSFFGDDGEDASEERLALVRIQGPIMNPEPVLAWIRSLEEKPNVKGVLLRVDSPGGGAAASQEIYAALARLGAKMPIVASMGSMAASGGLMASMAAERIYANPSTITGSIGVRMDIPQLEGLMEKIGVGQETIATAPFKDAASYTHPLSPQAREYLEGVLMNMHEQFVSIVAKGRKMDMEKARSLASGKIFTGEQALGLGLVDVMGGQFEAHQWLAKKTGTPMSRPLLKRRDSQKGLVELLAGAASALWLAIGPFTAPGGGTLGTPVFLYQF